MKFSEEMKMMLQIQHLNRQNEKSLDLQAIQEDYRRLLEKLLSEIKQVIRSEVMAELFSSIIEGDCALPLTPAVPCRRVPKYEEKPAFFSYEIHDGINCFCWADLCRGIYDGKRLASKNVCIELTEAGDRLLKDLAQAAEAEGIRLTFQPALMTKKGCVILPQFGQYEKVAGPHHGKQGLLYDYFVNAHYVIA